MIVIFECPQGKPNSTMRLSQQVKVCMVDTGVDYTHPDILPNLWVNPDESANGKDNDGDGAFCFASATSTETCLRFICMQLAVTGVHLIHACFDCCLQQQVIFSCCVLFLNLHLKPSQTTVRSGGCR